MGHVSHVCGQYIPSAWCSRLYTGPYAPLRVQLHDIVSHLLWRCAFLLLSFVRLSTACLLAPGLVPGAVSALLSMRTNGLPEHAHRWPCQTCALFAWVRWGLMQRCAQQWDLQPPGPDAPLIVGLQNCSHRL